LENQIHEFFLHISIDVSSRDIAKSTGVRNTLKSISHDINPMRPRQLPKDELRKYTIPMGVPQSMTQKRNKNPAESGGLVRDEKPLLRVPPCQVFII
jgi:hypothetical protein